MARRKKTDDWRKQRRNRQGSVYDYKGKIYARLQYIGEDGTRKDRKRLAKSRKHARELLKELLADHCDGGERALDSHRMTFRDLAQKFERGKLKRAEIRDGKKVAGMRSYVSTKSHLVPLLAHFARKHIRTIKHSEIEAYKLDRLQTPVRRGTDEKGKPIYRPRTITCVNRELELLRSILRYAEHSEWLTKSPFKKGASLISKSSERQRERVLSLDEERRLLEAFGDRTVTYTRAAHKRGTSKIPQHEITARDPGKRRTHLRALTITALDTAMRRGELFKLAWPDVDFTLNLIRVKATNTKSEKARSVAMTRRVRESLFALREMAPPDYSGAVFGIKGSVKYAFASALAKAKIEDLHFHDLRHTCITRMIRAGAPAAEVMHVSGHAQFSTFKRYLNPGREAAQASADLLAAYLDQSAPAEESQSQTVN